MVYTFTESLKEETDFFLQHKNTWKYVFIIRNQIVNTIFIANVYHNRVELDAQLKELRTAEKDLSLKQQELDEREKTLKEREKEFMQQLHQKLTASGPRVSTSL